MSGTVLVTGASGFVGANLVRTLLEQGRMVRAMFHSDRRALEGLDVESIQADIRDLNALERAMIGVDIVYHLAGSISLAMDSHNQMESVNVQGTRNVVATCLLSGVTRLVHFSSIDALYKQPVNEPIDEMRPLVDAGYPKASPYDRSKAEGERIVVDSVRQGLNAVIIRPTAMIGPNDFKPSYIGQALIQLAKGRIPALVSSGFDWVDVRDVVNGAVHAEQEASSGACYMLSGNWHTLREVAEMVSTYSHQAAPQVTVPMWLAEAFVPIMVKLANFNGTQPIYSHVTLNTLRGNRRVSSARARVELGYSPRPLVETIVDTLEWFKQNGYLGS